MAETKPMKRFGVVGGCASVAGVDIVSRLKQLLPPAEESGSPGDPRIYFEEESFETAGWPGRSDTNEKTVCTRKLYVFDMIRRFEQRKIDAVILPSFVNHTFIDELLPEIRLPIVNMMEALRAHIEHRFPDAKKIGVLASDFVMRQGLFDRYFDLARWSLVYPLPETQRDCLMPAVYGAQGITAGHPKSETIDRLERVCRDLLEQGAELIVPGLTEISLVVDDLRERGLPVINVNQVYAEYAMNYDRRPPKRQFKIGVVGGVGPAATVDFVNKIVRNTPARCDQEHLKMVVEMNPQIPDRTEHLIGNGVDPTIALYATCKRLEDDGASVITIPCNTAHAFIKRLQPSLSIPIINMLFETVEYIRKHYHEVNTIGLLATTGTVRSRVYHHIIEKVGDLDLLVPDETHQAKVMNAIYGKKGIKAGLTEGECRDDLLAALAHLVGRGAEIVILGCTELPLVLAQCDDFPVAGKRVVLLDPTEILARKCVSLALSANG